MRLTHMAAWQHGVEIVKPKPCLFPTQSYLHLINVVDSSICDFCTNEVETIEHLFFYCPRVYCLWEALQTILRTHGIRYNILNVDTALFGGNWDRMFNLILILLKYYIFITKLAKKIPSFNGFHNMVKVRLHGSPAEKFCGSGL